MKGLEILFAAAVQARLACITRQRKAAALKKGQLLWISDNPVLSGSIVLLLYYIVIRGEEHVNHLGASMAPIVFPLIYFASENQ